MTTTTIVAALRAERTKLAAQLADLDRAIAALNGHATTPERARRARIATAAKPKYRGVLKASVMAIVTHPKFVAHESIDTLVREACRHAAEVHHRRVPTKNMRQMVHTLVHEKILCRDADTGTITLCTDK